VKSAHLPAIALAAALALLALASSAQTPPKTPPPSGLTPAQTDERLKQLESRAEAAEKAAASAAMEKDYITRVQKQYESYYEKAFNTTMTVFGLISIIIAVISFFAGKFGLDFFDRRVHSAIDEASTKLRADITATIKTDLTNLRRENTSQTNELKNALTAQIAQTDQDLQVRSSFQFQAAQALAMAGAGRYAEAIESFRTALELYHSSKPQHLIATNYGVTTVNNIFTGLAKQYPGAFQEKAKEELANTLYDDLGGELASAALDIPWLPALIKERKQNLPKPPAPTPPQQP